jgi:AhpD family alkylhydroperoxidase
MPFVGVALAPGALGFREKELIILRTSVIQQCAYCVGTHSVVALKAQLSVEEIEGLRHRTVPDGLFSEREQVLLRWVDRLAETAGTLTDAARQELRAHFEEHEVVDLLLCCGATVMLNRYATALQLPLAPAHIDLLTEKGWL